MRLGGDAAANLMLALGAAVQARGIDRVSRSVQPGRHALPYPAALIGPVDQNECRHGFSPPLLSSCPRRPGAVRLKNDLKSSCADLIRASTSFSFDRPKAWVAGSSPAKTRLVAISLRSTAARFPRTALRLRGSGDDLMIALNSLRLRQS